jgi:beta-glucosidase
MAERRRLARSVAARAIVMLKNASDALPLADSLRRLLVVGPLADAAAEMRGPWYAAAAADGCVSVLAGLLEALPQARIDHTLGVGIETDDTSGIAAALRRCRQADAVVLCLGEASRMSGEAASRASLDLPGRQRTLAESICKRARSLGKPVIAVLFSGRPLAVPWLIEQADAVLAAWFLGAEAGHAIADVITGAVSPSGRTPVSWPRAVGQVPIFFGQRPSGRPGDPANRYSSKYLDVAIGPLFSFGHGLSYGRFKLSNLRVTPESVGTDETLAIQIDVLNEGARAAEETVFLFTHRLLASVTQPLLELKGFGKIVLRPGETGTVTLQLPAAQLHYLGPDLQPLLESGAVEILVGPCADRAQLLLKTVYVRAADASRVPPPN